jgi:hypothetical protein
MSKEENQNSMVQIKIVVFVILGQFYFVLAEIFIIFELVEWLP